MPLIPIPISIVSILPPYDRTARCDVHRSIVLVISSILIPGRLYKSYTWTRYAFNDPTNPNWRNPGQVHDCARGPLNILPSLCRTILTAMSKTCWSTTNDSIWIDPGGPVMTAPDGTLLRCWSPLASSIWTVASMSALPATF